MLSGVVKSRKQPRFILIMGGLTELALMGTVPAPLGPVRERSVTLNGNDTASQRPGISPTKVISEPVGVVVFGFDDPPQEVRNATASTAISAIVAIRLSIRSRLSPSLVPPARRPQHIPYRSDHEAESHRSSQVRPPATLPSDDEQPPSGYPALGALSATFQTCEHTVNSLHMARGIRRHFSTHATGLLPAACSSGLLSLPSHARICAARSKISSRLIPASAYMAKILSSGVSGGMVCEAARM